MNTLDENILLILRAAARPVQIAEIERLLGQSGVVNTFDVRDAVWRLVSGRRADFTPIRDVVAI